MKKFKKYFKVWWLLSKNSFANVFYSKLFMAVFLTGKILRFAFFFAFIYFLVEGTKTLAGYSANEVLFFFLTCNIVDIIPQFLFRSVYRFRSKVVSGKLDLTLVRPINPLFISLMGEADVMDLITIPPLLIGTIYLAQFLNPTFIQSVYYILLVVNGLILATAFHIAVMAMGIIVLEVDHSISIYRDIINLGKFPVDIYRQPLGGILTFLIPIGVMITLPVKALIGLVSPIGVIAAFFFGALVFFLSLRFWNFALTKYTSASS